jgi:hypothetical protein
MPGRRAWRILGRMRPELDDTLAAPASDLGRTATAPGAASPGQPSALAIGQQLGHFRIERPLGAGGMGEVYLATDLALDRPVAIKVLPGGDGTDAARRDRLIREARAQARITHPNVGHIYFIGEAAGRLYFAMEYVAGETLSARLAAGPIPVEEALAFIRSAALGLREAQRNGITHRDIKPSNLMIDGFGMVKVLDFGLAASSLTATGPIDDGPVAQTSFGGTPLYMAPEQARGEPVDFRADIYALGATLFHLVAGHPPFEADDLGTLLTKHASADRPTLPRRSGTPRTMIAAIDALCSRMMATSPAQRFASYDELIRAIELASVEHLRPAGLWVRSMTTFVDLIIAAIIIGLGLAATALVVNNTGGEVGGFAFLVYALGGALAIARNGRTPGQWLFELEVVDVATGRKPSFGRALVRMGLPVAVPFAATTTNFIAQKLGHRLDDLYDVAFALVSAVAPIALVWASVRSVRKQAFWDKLSGTMVRYRTRRTTTI